MTLFDKTTGPHDARIMIVGEAWGAEEERLGYPFAGSSGHELNRMLNEAGISREACFCTNVVNERPPNNDIYHFFFSNQEAKASKLVPCNGLFPRPNVLAGLSILREQIEAVNPALIIAAGNYPLWALVGCGGISSFSPKNASGTTYKEPTGITSWRGSMLEKDGRRILPIIHPAAIMRAWYLRAVTIHDLKRRVPQALQDDWRPKHAATYLAPPSFKEACDLFRLWLDRMDRGERLRLSHDIETSRSHITCQGFGEGSIDGGIAMAIPLIRPTPDRRRESYWTHDEEVTLARLIRQTLTHPNVLIEGQNYLYDTQYIQFYLACTPRLDFDTMLAHHLLFPGTPKDLGYLSSLYTRHHWYWKDDLKEWDEHINFDLNLRYNCVDVLRTAEIAGELRSLIPRMGMKENWEWEQKKGHLALELMNRGILIDKAARAAMAAKVFEEQNKLASWFASIIPQSLLRDLTKSDKKWYESVQQQKILFYDLMGLPRRRQKKTGRDTIDDEALMELEKQVPELSRIFEALQSYRSCGVFRNNFLTAALDPDERMRCMINTGGTKTFRWSTSENAFGRGTNLQNIPSGDEE